MTDLSPAAQAVLDAAFDPWQSTDTPASIAAAALRAVADQLQMHKALGDTDADAGVFAAHHAIYAQLIAIADELEGAAT